MIAFGSFTLPPLLLMYVKNRNRKMEWKKFILEYLVTVLLENTIIIAFFMYVLKYEGNLSIALNEDIRLIVHYNIVAIGCAILIPLAMELLPKYFKVGIQIPIVKIQIPVTVILYCYTVLLVALNFWKVNNNAFTGDEYFTFGLIRAGMPKLITITAGDVHPPLYYIILWLFCKIFPNGAILYRTVSLIPYTLLVIWALLCLRREFGSVPAGFFITCTSILNAAEVINPDARMYTWASFFVVMSFWTLYYVMKREEWKDWILFCFFSLCAAYTHYYALLNICFFYLGLLIYLLVKKKTIKKWLIISLSAFIGYLPWLWIFLMTFKRTVDSWWLNFIPSVDDCLNFIFDLWWMKYVFAVSFLFFLAYETKFLIIEIKNGKRNIQAECIGKIEWILIGVGTLIGTMTVGLGLSHLVRPLIQVQYLFPIAQVIWVIMGICISHLKGKKIWGILILLLLVTTDVPRFINLSKAEMRLGKQTAEFEKNVAVAEDDIVITDNEQFAKLLGPYYYEGKKVIYGYNPEEHITTGEGKIWLIGSSGTIEELGERYGVEIGEPYYSGFLNETELTVYCKE